MKLSITKLKESNDFLNNLFENITSAIFLVDENVRIQEFNNTFKALFNKKEENILGGLCGNVIGCKYTVDERKDCGYTSNCNKCTIRESIIKALNDKESTFKKMMNREFYISQEPIRKYFQFTTRYMNYKDKNMALVIIDDVTEIENSKIELRKRNEIIETYNKKIKDELALARNVQQSLIPYNIPNIDGIGLSAIYNPLEEVGGDLYDFIHIDEDNLGIFISDISGHGVPAAMITAMVKAIMETSKNLLYKPDKLMKYINKKLVNVAENMYLTAFYGVYNIKTNEFTYVRCSHPYPILIRDGELIEIKDSKGMLLGIFDDIEFKSKKILLKNSDKIIFYTDGLTETKNKEGIEFSEKLYDIIKDKSCDEIHKVIDNIYKNLILFKEEKGFEDDICILGMEIK